MLKKLIKSLIEKDMNLNESTKNIILEHYFGKPIPDLSFATVKDFCDSADYLPQVIRFESSLKDVQRPWAVKAILGTIPMGSKILEIGGGEPLVSGLLQQLGYQVTLIDPYDGSGNGPKEYLQFQHAYPNIRILREYFKKDCPSLAGETFDCIFSVSVLEHIPTENLKELFDGINQYLKPGGYSIHCIDDVIEGPTADWHFQEVSEALALQSQLQDTKLNPTNARTQAEIHLKELHEQIHKDIETYYHSPLEFYRWKNGAAYEEYSFRKIVSVQSCLAKSDPDNAL